MREDRNPVVLYNIVTGTLDAPGSRPFYQSSKLALGPRLGRIMVRVKTRT